MSMNPALRSFFEEQVRFRLDDGTEVEGGVYVGSTEFLPVETLRGDADAYQAEFDSWLNEIWVPAQQELRSKLLRFFRACARKKRFSFGEQPGLEPRWLSHACQRCRNLL